MLGLCLEACQLEWRFLSGFIGDNVKDDQLTALFGLGFRVSRLGFSPTWIPKAGIE